MTKNADQLLRSLWKEYKRRVSSGVADDDALIFGDAYDVVDICHLERASDDVDSDLKVLSSSGYIRAFYADGMVYHFYLTSAAIEYMESYNINRVKSVFAAAMKIISVFKS